MSLILYIILLDLLDASWKVSKCILFMSLYQTWPPLTKSSLQLQNCRLYGY